MTVVALASALPTSPGTVALACIARRWRVLPLRWDTKLPAIKQWPERATLDTVDFEEWFAWNQHRVGILTGPESGIFVIDIDVKSVNGFTTLRDLFAAHGEDAIPRSFRVRTPSGGMHIYGRWPEGLERTRDIGSGVEIKGWHHQVVAPDGAGYRVIEDSPLWTPPDWFVEVIRRPARGPLSIPLTADPGWSRLSIRAAAHRLSRATHGDRNPMLNRTAFGLGQLGRLGYVGEDEAWNALREACEQSGLLADDGEDQCRKTFESGWRAGLDAT